MEKRIELEKRGRRANQITELNLDNCRSTSIVGLTDEFTALESLSLINVGLTTLKGFPKLPNLKKLELSDNRISNGLNYLSTSPKLTHLNLSGNKIKDLETLKPLESFQNLEVLDLFNNEATSFENYREKIFAMIPSLKYLDGFDANEVEASSDGDDDEEVNGNDSEDDDCHAFTINGLEIDLKELNEFERSLKEKKSHRFNAPISNEPDDLDEYLNKLHIKNIGQISTPTQSLINSYDSSVTYSQITLENNSIFEQSFAENVETRKTNIALLMLGFIAILSLVSYSCFSDEMGESDDDESDDESDDEDNGVVSLAKIYNDDLEEDNSDWEEEIEAEEDDDDDESDEEEGADEAANQKEAETPAEEPQARGKKRKHEEDV